MRVADATVAFLGEYAGLEKDVTAGAQPAASKLTGIFQQAMKSAFSQKLEIGGALFTGLGVGLTAMNDPIEKAQATLRQVIENTGNSWDAYKGKVEDAINTQARFGHGSADTQTALGRLTAAYQDPKKAVEQMGLAEQIAAFDHISLTAAADKVVRMHGGAARTFKEFGINVADMKKEVAAATAAEKADTTAGDALTKAKQHLADVHALLAGKTKLTTSEQITLRNATAAVTDAAEKANAAHQHSVAAQAAAKGATADYDKIMRDQLLPRLHGVAEAQADTWGGKLLGYKTNVMNFVGEAAGPLGHGLTVLGPLMTGVGGAIQLLSMFTGAHTAATAVDTVAVEASTGVGLLGRIGMAAGAVVTGVMTAAQWALNVALDANPIGLVVIAIAGLIGILILAYNNIKPVRDAINWLWGEIQILWHWIVGGSPGLVPAFQELISIIGTVIGVALLPIKLEFTLLSAAVGAVWNILKGVGGWLSSTFGGILSGTIGTIGNIVSTISGEFGRLPGQLVAIGGQIIGGLIKGLLGGIGGIAGAVGQVASSVVSGFKGLLGIHSPSTVFADQVGGPIVEGIGMGITKSGAAHRALAGLHLTAPNIGGIAAGNMSLSALSGAAAGKGGLGGMTNYFTINNPVPEAVSTSAPRELRKLAYLGQAT